MSRQANLERVLRMATGQCVEQATRTDAIACACLLAHCGLSTRGSDAERERSHGVMRRAGAALREPPPGSPRVH